MRTLLRRPTRTLCFFCQSSISPPPPQPLSFLCPHCACWNHYDANGNILSDDPAMHDESLNGRSFARRASPRKDRLLTTFGNAPFCSVCQSNQRLVNSLLSSYLPPSDDDPDYAPRLAGFAAYKASIYARYPLVCEKCAPLVEEEIRKKDDMARSNALGSWLNESKKKDSRRQHVSLSNMNRDRLSRELRWWTARGALWVATLVVAVSADVAGAMGRMTLPERGPLVPSLPLLTFLSILWTAWLPTYAHFRRAELQGRKVRMRGRERYIILQAAVWAERMLTTSLIALPWYRPSMDLLSLHSHPASVGGRIYFTVVLCFEVFISIYSFLTLRLHRAPAVRLIDSSTSRASTPSTNASSRTSHTPPPHFSTTTNATNAKTSSTSHRAHAYALDPPTLLDSLSLSSAPIPLRTWHASGPVFGHTSLRPATFHPMSSSPPPPPPSLAPSLVSASQSRDTEMRSRDDEDEDVMDWTPTTSPVLPELASRGHLSPQKATGAITGLETLLERTNIIDTSELDGQSSRTRRRGGVTKSMQTWSWGWVYALSLVPLVAMMYYHLG